MDHGHDRQEGPPSFWRSRYSLGLLFFAGVAGYLLLSEHRDHFFSALPFLLLLGCPLMHVFMHHGHGGHSHGAGAHEGGPADRPRGGRT